MHSINPSGRRAPGYCLHKSSGRGYALFGGRGGETVYFPGPHGSPESQAAYRRACAEWLAGGRPGAGRPADALTVRQLLALWWREAEARYRKYGRPTNELACQKSALRFLRELYPDTPAAEFGPVQLAAVRERMVREGWVRTSINLHVCRIRTVFKWAAGQGLLPESTHRALTMLDGLRKGRTAAAETEPKEPVTVWQLLAVLRRCGRAVGAMVRLQYLCGMRPGEVCALRPCDLDRSGPVWRYRVRPECAKVGSEVYWLGPRTIAVLSPWLRGVPPEAKVFGYTVGGYRRHVARTCAQVGCAHWAPHQLRHNHGTNVCNGYGEEAAAKRLNHTQTRTVKRYSRTASALARRIAREVG